MWWGACLGDAAGLTGARHDSCHQLRGLLTGAATGDALGNAEQWMGLAFALVEVGNARGGFGFVVHEFGTMEICATRLFPHIGMTAAHGVENQAWCEPGRPKGLPRTAVITTRTIDLARFPHPITEPSATGKA